jgi:hypothetical protein
VTHVAGRKLLVNLPDPGPYWETNLEKWAEIHAEQSEVLKHIQGNKGYYDDINLLFAGRTFVDSDIKTFLNRIKELKNIGYHVPDWVIEDIEMEANRKIITKT